MWEVMMMLQRGKAEYIKESKEAFMLDATPITEIDKIFPSPRVINTHLRLDVLPKEFRARKTVCGKTISGKNSGYRQLNKYPFYLAGADPGCIRCIHGYSQHIKQKLKENQY